MTSIGWVVKITWWRMNNKHKQILKWNHEFWKETQRGVQKYILIEKNKIVSFKYPAFCFFVYYCML